MLFRSQSPKCDLSQPPGCPGVSLIAELVSADLTSLWFSLAHLCHLQGFIGLTPGASTAPGARTLGQKGNRGNRVKL